jgi:hypothetical protein
VEFVTQIFGLAINLSKSTALRGVNALVQCKEGQVFTVRTVTLVRDGFSTNFSTFLLKSFDRGGCRLPTVLEWRTVLRIEKENLSHSPFSGKSFSRRFF